MRHHTAWHIALLLLGVAAAPAAVFGQETGVATPRPGGRSPDQLPLPGAASSRELGLDPAQLPLTAPDLPGSLSPRQWAVESPLTAQRVPAHMADMIGAAIDPDPDVMDRYHAELREAQNTTGKLEPFAKQVRDLLPGYIAKANGNPSDTALTPEAFARIRSLATVIATQREHAGKSAQMQMLKPTELAAIEGMERARLVSRGVPEEWIRVRPVTIDGQAIVEIVGPPDEVGPRLKEIFGDDRTKMVGGDPIPDLPGLDNPDFQRGLGSAPDQVGDLAGRPVSTATVEGLFLQTVALQSTTQVACSGVLVSPNAVLTAAHCACRGDLREVSIGSDAAAPARTLVIEQRNYLAGAGICTAARDAGGWTDEVIRKGDLALLTLEAEAAGIGGPGSHLAPLNIAYLLAAESHLRAADYVTVVGFGSTGSVDFNTHKNRGLIKIASRDCNAFRLGADPSASSPCVPGAELVAINPLNDVDSCFGDSGGPAFVELADGRFALAAIVSRGLETGKPGCAAGGIYVLVTTQRVRDWLESAIGTLPTAPENLTVATAGLRSPGN